MGNNEQLLLMLNAIRLEIRNLNLQHITANAISRGVIPDTVADEAALESRALRERSDNAANTALDWSRG